MEWTTNDNDTEHSVNTEHQSLVSNMNNDDFSNINTNNYDLNQFSQLINLNSTNTQDLITSNVLIDNRTSHNQGLLQQNNQISSNNSSLIKSHFDDNDEKSNSLSRLLLIQNKDEMGSYNNIFSNDPVNSIFIAEFLNSNPLESNQDHLNHHHHPQNISQTIEVSTTLDDDLDKPDTTPKKQQLNRYNYKCNYCLHLTKFKAHIIEHMLTEHKIDLMQCPYSDCLKKFKDEWKLKRHLASNKDHLKAGTYKDLNDCLKQHINITPQKIGQYPCPLCQIEPLTGNVICNDEIDQETSIQNLINKNLDNSLFFDKYDDLREHCTKNHPSFNIDSYFICKTCGQVFLNRYKLSCHHFNVHSGKRKPRNKTPGINEYSQVSLDMNSVNNDNITDVIDSVAKGMGTVEKFFHANKMRPVYEAPVQERKYLCVVCSRKFKRVRDLQTHVHIMHKTISETQKEELKQEIEKTNMILAKNRRSRNRSAQIDYHSVNLLSNNDPNTKICFICNKIFRAVQNHELSTTPGVTNTFNLAKSFQRHLQLQHGINEKGEKLIDCPVCEKSFFSKIQLERHLRTHQIWIEDESCLLAPSVEPLPEHRLKHSILYCHECVECSIFFKSIKVLTKHKKDAHNLKPVFKCANTIDCNRQFDSIDLFLDHSKMHSQKNIVCTKCKIKFMNKNMLRIHMKNFHYKTSLTKKTNNLTRTRKQIGLTTENLTPIIINSNPNDPNKINKSDFICPTCGQEFTSRNSLHNHLATHNTSDLKLFMCNLCNASFKTRKELSRHAATHDFQKHKTCPECGETFKTSFHLKRHSLTRHSNIRPFKCNHCEMTFARKDKLKQHEAKHINHPLYKCSECNKGFYRKEHLKDHEISKHSKQYPFSCEHCSKGFVHAKDLHRHIRVRHLGNAPPKTKKMIDETQQNFSQVKHSDVKIQHQNQQNLQHQQQHHHHNHQQQHQQHQHHQQKIIYQIPQINGVNNNDFKSKKISSILKSNYLVNPAEPPRPVMTTPVITQTPILLTQTHPIQILSDPCDKINSQTCQIITLRINDLNSILDKLNTTNATTLNTSTTTMNNNVNNNNNNNNNSNINVINNANGINNNVNINQSIQSIVNQESKDTINTLMNKPTEKSFKCSTCSKSFFYENQLNKHIQTKHSENPQFACSICSKEFPSRSSAKYHIENGHVEFSCPICYKVFKNKSHAQRHIDSSHPASNQNDLKPMRQCKNEPKLIDISAKYNKLYVQSNNNNNNNQDNGSVLIQTFDNNINNYVLEPKIDANNNNLVNFNFDRPTYPNIIWSNPSTSSTSPNSSSITQSPINQANTSLFILNNNQQQSININDNITNQSFFI